MWETILTTACTVLVSLTITLIFNGVINLPKKKREKEEKEQKERKALQDSLNQAVTKNNEKIYAELKKQSKADKDALADLKLCKLGLQAVIKNTLKTRYEKWIQEGHAPLDAKDDLERMYQVYHQLGANGVMDSLRAKFLALPDALPGNDE